MQDIAIFFRVSLFCFIKFSCCTNSIIQNYLLFLHPNKRVMRIVSHKRLKEFYETKGREDSRVALERWYDVAEKAEWKNLSDIKVDFPAPLGPTT